MAERKQTYGEMLLSMHWFAKRSHIIKLAKFECVECGAHQEEHQFEVHHRYYLRGRKPWEYPDEALMCVCRTCHAELGMLDDELRYTIGQLTTQQIEQVRVFARRLHSTDCTRSSTAIAGRDLPQTNPEGSGGEMAKLPAFQFYVGDWMKDPALRACGPAARGLWMDMLCLMFETARRGYLQHTTGAPVTPEQLARMTGCTADEVTHLLRELEDSGVFSRTENGVIYSRRIARDEDKRAKCVAAGKLGGNPTLKGGLKGGPKGRSKGQSQGGSEPETRGQHGADHHAADLAENSGSAAPTTPTLKGAPKGDAKGRSKGDANRKPTPSSSSSPSGEEETPSESLVGEEADVLPMPCLSRAGKPPSPHQRCMSAFADGWSEKYGEKYLLDAKAGKLVKEMLAHVDGDAEKFERALRRYLASDGKYVSDARHSLGLFRTQFSAWLVEDRGNGTGTGVGVGRAGRAVAPGGKYSALDGQSGLAVRGGSPGGEVAGEQSDAARTG
jgi:hypothetical protein